MEEVDDEILHKVSRSYVDFSKIDDEQLVSSVTKNKTIFKEEMENEIIPNVIFGLIDYDKYQTAAKILLFHIKDTKGKINKNLMDFLAEYSIKWTTGSNEEFLTQEMKKKISQN